jgi:hypothetical protein
MYPSTGGHFQPVEGPRVWEQFHCSEVPVFLSSRYVLATGKWQPPVWGPGGGLLQWHMGYCVRWQLGPNRCQGGVPAAWLRGSSVSPSSELLWWRNWSHHAGWRAVLGEWRQGVAMHTQWMVCPQLWPPRGCQRHLLRWALWARSTPQWERDSPTCSLNTNSPE